METLNKYGSICGAALFERMAYRGDFVLAHEEADMELFRVPFTDLLDAVLSGAVRDAPVALAVLAAQVRGLAPTAGLRE